MRLRRKTVLATIILAGVSVLATMGQRAAAKDPAALATQVRDAERAFAKTMADRDHAAFGRFVAEEARFFGQKEVFRGRAQVIDGWKRFFEGERAPFSWEPEQVEVLDSGTLALSSGPVRDPQGNQIGTFSSIWRRESHGKWRVIFDKGCPPCRCP